MEKAHSFHSPTLRHPLLDCCSLTSLNLRYKDLPLFTWKMRDMQRMLSGPLTAENLVGRDADFV